jgi:hypothetical protein
MLSETLGRRRYFLPSVPCALCVLERVVAIARCEIMFLLEMILINLKMRKEGCRRVAWENGASPSDITTKIF